MNLPFFAIDSKFVRGKELLNVLEKGFFAVLFHVGAPKINEFVAVFDVLFDAVPFRGERLA
jgi:hypothetical protein